ncbi:MAG: hypothetical protein PF638_05575 [Candidatus Delongbacteria bacterium]|jgi:hypothetical protein|nr:hypothetical protein [Candidatus Delongbacteria bacterium]
MGIKYNFRVENPQKLSMEKEGVRCDDVIQGHYELEEGIVLHECEICKETKLNTSYRYLDEKETARLIKYERSIGSKIKSHYWICKECYSSIIAVKYGQIKPYPL